MKKCDKPFVINIPADVFAVVQKFAAKNDVRFYLNGVFCCEKFIAATDGKSLMISPHAGSATKAVIIPPIPATYLKKDSNVRVLDDDSVCVVNYYGQIVYYSPQNLIGGTFPDVICVVEKMGLWEEGTGAATCDVAFIAKAISQLKGGVKLFNSNNAICAVATGQYPVQPGAMVVIMGRSDRAVTPSQALAMVRNGH